jgi:hypothetical protein
MLQVNELKEITSTLDKIISFFTTFGSLGGLSIIFFVALIILGYKYLTFRLKQNEKQTEEDLKKSKDKIDYLKQELAKTQLSYELQIKDMLNEQKVESIKEASKLRSHPFFQSCEYWITRVELFPMRDKFRHTVFVDYVRIFLRTGKHVWEELIDEILPNIEDLSTMELYSRVVKLLHRKNTLTEHECKELGIPDVFLDKVSEDWNGPTEKLLYICISSICNSDRFESNSNRLAVILNLMTSLYEVMVFEAESLVEELNGELEGAMYKGMVCCEKKNHN